MSLAHGSMLGSRYSLEERIGAGGYSEVWRAHDTVLDRPVAIKLLNSGHAQHAETLMRFRNEAQLAGRLAHVNVARVYDFRDSRYESAPYLVMELIEGPSLADILRHGPLSPVRTMDVIAQAAAGLAAAHAAGLVHRDIKPANIMLAPGGVVKITDFGVSHTLGSAPITGTGLLIGTPGYLAPERAAGARATQAGDIYALGVVGYECLSGFAPFTGSPLEVALAHREQPLPPLPRSTPSAVADLIERLTAKDPADRPTDAAQVAQRAAELRGALAGDGFPSRTMTDQSTFSAAITPNPGRGPVNSPTLVTAMPPAQSRPDLHRPGRAWLAAAAVVAAAVVILAVIALVRSGSGGTPSANIPSSTPPATPSTSMVDVQGSALIGQQLQDAANQLQAQGFQVQWIFQQSQDGGASQPTPITVSAGEHLPHGQVVAVNPAGPQPLGSVITLVVAGQHGDHGGGGDGNGNGGG